jgi:hypothetical protein
MFLTFVVVGMVFATSDRSVCTRHLSVTYDYEEGVTVPIGTERAIVVDAG